MLKHEIRHCHVTPYWPRANGEIERFMIPLTKVMITAKLEDKPYLTEVDNFLMAHRVTPHTTTKAPPSEVMFNQKIRYNIPSVDDKIDNKVQNSLDENDKIGKLKQRYYANRHCKTRAIEIGDKILVLQKKQNKLTPKFNQYPYVVTEIKGTMITAENPVNTHRVTRNISQFVKVPPDAHPPRPIEETFNEEEDDRSSHKIDCSSPSTSFPLYDSDK